MLSWPGTGGLVPVTTPLRTSPKVWHGSLSFCWHETDRVGGIRFRAKRFLDECLSVFTRWRSWCEHDDGSGIKTVGEQNLQLGPPRSLVVNCSAFRHRKEWRALRDSVSKVFPSSIESGHRRTARVPRWHHVSASALTPGSMILGTVRKRLNDQGPEACVIARAISAGATAVPWTVAALELGRPCNRVDLMQDSVVVQRPQTPMPCGDRCTHPASESDPLMIVMAMVAEIGRVKRPTVNVSEDNRMTGPIGTKISKIITDFKYFWIKIMNLSDRGFFRAYCLHEQNVAEVHRVILA
jgi:hypothetical protein